MSLSRHNAMPLQRRHDLKESTLSSQSEMATVIKDPIALRYFRLRDSEIALLNLIDGERSLAEICDAMQQQFPALHIEEQQLHQAIQNLHKQGMLISSAPNQGVIYENRKNEQTKKKAAQVFSSILAIRFPGINPTPFLNLCYPIVRWALHPISIFVCLVFMLSALVLLLTNLEEFYNKLPTIGSFFALDNLPFLAATILVSKTIHELGHAFVCKHFGAECHSIGFMLLVLSPAAYCDTSDSWMLPSKTKRILIAAAGMFFELILAAAAVFVWWYTQPNWFHFFCLNLVIVSSVSTILFNANPLLRYDGYYILSDLLEIPNMAQRSRTALLSWLRQLTLGLPAIKGELLPVRHRVLFCIYAVAAFVYRWFIMGVIYWFLIQFFESHQVSAIGYLIVTASLGWMLVQPMWKLIKFFREPGRIRQIKSFRVILTASLLAIGGWFAFLVPLNQSVTATFVVEPAAYRTLFVETAGILRSVEVQPGDTIEQGRVVAQLSNVEIESEVTELQSQIAQLAAEIETFKTMQGRNSTSAISFSAKVTEIQKLRLQLASRQTQLEKLQIVAPQSGIIVPVVESSLQTNDQHEALDLFQAQSLNGYLESETPICTIASDDRFKVVAFFSQSDIERIKYDQTTELLLDEYLDTPISGAIESISRKKTESIPAGLSRQFGGEIGIDIAVGAAQPISPMYRVEISLGEFSLPLNSGMRGQVKVITRQASLFQRAKRWAMTTFRFR